MSSSLTSAQAAHLVAKFIEQQPNKKWSNTTLNNHSSKRKYHSAPSHVLSKVLFVYCANSRSRSSLSEVISNLQHPPAAPIAAKQPNALVQEMMSSATGKEKAERRAAASIAAASSKRVNRRRSEAPRPSTAASAIVGGRRRSRSGCRSCSKSRSPNRVLTPPRRSTPPPTHPAASRGSIHAHAFVVSHLPAARGTGNHHSAAAATTAAAESKRGNQKAMATSKKEMAKKKAKEQLLDPAIRHVSAATLSRLAQRGASAASSETDSKPQKKSADHPHEEEKEQSAEVNQRMKEVQIEGSTSSVSPRGIAKVAFATTSTSGETNAPSFASPSSSKSHAIDPSSLPPAGLTTARGSMREGKRHWLFAETAQADSDETWKPEEESKEQATTSATKNSRKSFTATSTSLTAQPIQKITPTGSVVPQPYVPVRSNHNQASINVLQHESRPSDEGKSDDHTNSYRDLTEQIKHARYNHTLTSKENSNLDSSQVRRDLSNQKPSAAAVWDAQRTALLAELTESQRRENSALARLNSKRTRPEGAVSWWPDEVTYIEQEEQALQESQRNRIRNQRAAEPAGLQVKQVEQPAAQIQYAPDRSASSMARQRRHSMHASPPRNEYYSGPAAGVPSARDRIASPVRIPHAHHDIAEHERESRPVKSPFKAIPLSAAATYSSTFRQSGSAAPLAGHEQHKYNLRHRRDSESSEGEYSFKNSAGENTKREVEGYVAGEEEEKKLGSRSMNASFRSSSAAIGSGNGSAAFFIPSSAAKANRARVMRSSLNETAFSESMFDANQARGGAGEQDFARSSNGNQGVQSSLSRSYVASQDRLDHSFQQAVESEAVRQMDAQAQLDSLIRQQRDDEERRFLQQRQQHLDRQNASQYASASPSRNASLDFAAPSHASSRSFDSTISSVLDLAENPLVRAFQTDVYSGSSAVNDAAHRIIATSPNRRAVAAAAAYATATAVRNANSARSSPVRPSPLSPAKSAESIYYETRAAEAAAAANAAATAAAVANAAAAAVRARSPLRYSSPLRNSVGGAKSAFAPTSPAAALAASLSSAAVAAASIGQTQLSSSLAAAAMHESHVAAAEEAEKRAVDFAAQSAAARAIAAEKNAALELELKRLELQRDQLLRANFNASSSSASFLTESAYSTAIAPRLASATVKDIMDGSVADTVVNHFAPSSVPLSSSLHASSLNTPFSPSAAPGISAALSRRAMENLAARERERAAIDEEYVNSLKQQRADAERRMEELTRKAMRDAQARAHALASAAATSTFPMSSAALRPATATTAGGPSFTPSANFSASSSFAPGASGAPLELSTISSLGRTEQFISSHGSNSFVASDPRAQFPHFAAASSIRPLSTGLNADTPSSLSERSSISGISSASVSDAASDISQVDAPLSSDSGDE